MVKRKNVFVELIQARAKTIEQNIAELENEKAETQEQLDELQRKASNKIGRLDDRIVQLKEELQDAQQAVDAITATLPEVIVSEDDGAIESPPQGGPKK